VSEVWDSEQQRGRGGSSVGDLLLSLFCLVLFPLYAAFEDQLRPWIISRSTANALFQSPRTPEIKNTTRPDVPEEPWKYIVLHHSAGKNGSTRSIHQQHLRRKDSNGNPWKGIGYHFVIGNGNGMPDGSVEATFRWKQQLHGAHAGHSLYNTRGIGICLIGNFDESPPTTAQLETLLQLVTQLARQHQLAPEDIIGHSAFRRTACPGSRFPLQKFRQQVSDSLAQSAL
jgi:hypothetical protein